MQQKCQMQVLWRTCWAAAEEAGGVQALQQPWTLVQVWVQAVLGWLERHHRSHPSGHPGLESHLTGCQHALGLNAEQAEARGAREQGDLEQKEVVEAHCCLLG